jgi:hypothetical protein
MELYGNDAGMWGASVPKDILRLRRAELGIPENISNNYQKKTSVTFSSKFSSVSRKAYFNNEEELLKFYKEYLVYVEGEE